MADTLDAAWEDAKKAGNVLRLTLTAERGFTRAIAEVGVDGKGELLIDRLEVERLGEVEALRVLAAKVAG